MYAFISIQYHHHAHIHAHRGVWGMNCMFLRLTSIASACACVMLCLGSIRIAEQRDWLVCVCGSVCAVATAVNACVTYTLASNAALLPDAFPQNKQFAYW
jgi:hypothetical protein